jgi:hypothetical protein
MRRIPTDWLIAPSIFLIKHAARATRANCRCNTAVGGQGRTAGEDDKRKSERGTRVRTRPALVFAPGDRFAIVVAAHTCMIGCSAVVIRSICAGVVMLLSSRPKCTCCTPDTMYCQR